MPKRLFVGGLPWDIGDEELAEIFRPYAKDGDLQDFKVVTDRDTGRSRGFGFVTFSDENDADEAIEKMNNTEVDGRPLTVNVAKERKSGGGRSSHGNRPVYGGG
ncbi:MAG: RNA-binding protein [Myxococcota bacterium]